MSISGIQPCQGAYAASFSQRGSKCSCESSTGKPIAPDSVEISDKAKELAQQAQAERAQGQIATGQPDGATADKVLPLEAYSIPGWMGDFTPQHSAVDVKIGQTYAGSNAELYDSLSPNEKDDLSEYMHTLHTFYMEEKGSRGINTNEEYYNAIVLNQQPGLSEEIHQAVRQRLAADSRAMELMQHFGVTL